MKGKLTVADLIAGIGGAVALLFSFLPFVRAPSGFGGGSRNAWSRDAFAFVSTIPAILGLAMVVIVVLIMIGVALPDNVLTFNWDQIKVTLGVSAAGIMLGWLTADFGGFDQGIGLWFMLLGSLAMATGAILGVLGVATNSVLSSSGGGAAPQAPPPPGQPGSAPPPPGGGTPPPPGGGTPPPPPAG